MPGGDSGIPQKIKLNFLSEVSCGFRCAGDGFELVELLDWELSTGLSEWNLDLLKEETKALRPATSRERALSSFLTSANSHRGQWNGLVDVEATLKAAFVNPAH